MQYFSEVETLNRGLDLAQTARESGDEQALQAEFERNILKATRLVPLGAVAENSINRREQWWMRISSRTRMTPNQPFNPITKQRRCLVPVARCATAPG